LEKTAYPESLRKGKNAPGIAAEMWDQLQIFGRMVCDEQIRAEIKFNGQLDFDLLKKAIRLSFIAEPILGYKYVEHFWRPEWVTMNEIDWEEVVSYELMDPDRKNINNFLIRQIDPFHGPQVLIKLFRSENDILCVLLNHTVGDGTALKSYLYLLAKIYRRIIDSPDYIPGSNWSRSRSITQVSNQLNFKTKVKILIRSFRKQEKYKDWAFPWKRGENNGRKRIITRKLSPELTTAIHSYMEKHHAWLNEVLLAAYIRTLYGIIEPTKDLSKRVCIPTDLRKYLPVRQAGTICNLSATLHLNPGEDIGNTFHETLGLVHREMNVIKNSYPGLVGRGFFAIMMKLLPYRSLKKKLTELPEKPNYHVLPPWLINFGIMNASLLNFGHTNVNDIYIAQTIGYPDKSPFQLGVTEFKDSLTFSVCYQGNEETDFLIQRFFNQFENELLHLE
jgi:NRPS condensation-like uncharacterized protein